ncbi:MAG TPA: DegT/DnrJ/EryC1/StrS family aminotransferase [Bryobacteraceae bacterium]|nr:DegT/DnrJ/EryC1/StrS family aminotransferase [Bryobacteraceae bacterium]
MGLAATPELRRSPTRKPIPLLDLEAQQRPIRDEILAAVTRVIDSRQFILGEEVRQLEEEIASYCGTAYAIGCASGSDALFLALLALGIGPGDAVLTTPFTFFATAGEISRIGATPVFADVAEQTFNLDPNLLGEKLATRPASSPRIRAILPVHLFGGCADMDAICELAEARGIAVIEDAAQAIGAEYRGRRAGSLGRLGCFSFYPTKNLGALGDGGILTTNDAELAGRLRALRVHGSTNKYVHQWIGINSRLDALQAAALRVKLPHLDGWSEGRARNAARYRERLRSSGVTCPVPTSYQSRHIYNQFTIRHPERDGLQAHLKKHGIGSEVYYPLPLHLQPCYAGLGYRRGDFPVAEKLAAECLSLPVQAELTTEDIDFVCDVILAYRPNRSES